MIDKKAKKILFDTYWKGGWIDEEDRKIIPDDLRYAQSQGVMFDPMSITHDDCIYEIIRICADLTSSLVGGAFLASLSTRRVDWRSALASYHFGVQMKKHTYMPVVSGQSFDMEGNVTHESHTCEICRDVQYGVIGDEVYEDVDVNVLNFERLKWGGVRHGEILYTLFDLQRFVDDDIAEPTEEDITLFQTVLKTSESLADDAFPSALVDALKDVLKASKDELHVLIDVLAAVGVLKAGDEDRPEATKHDWSFAMYWRGEDGYEQKAVDTYFGDFL